MKDSQKIVRDSERREYKMRVLGQLIALGHSAYQFFDKSHNRDLSFKNPGHNNTKV